MHSDNAIISGKPEDHNVVVSEKDEKMEQLERDIETLKMIVARQNETIESLRSEIKGKDSFRECFLRMFEPNFGNDY